MSENTICKICGGYIGNATLHATLTAPVVSMPPIIFCPGHSTTDAELVGHFPIMCTGVGPEPVHMPVNTSIQFPDMDVLWQIAQAVAEEDSIEYNEYEPAYTCPFCDMSQTHPPHLHEPFQHTADCIVTKARTLMKQREQQPRLEFHTEAADATVITNAIIRWKELINKKDGE